MKLTAPVGKVVMLGEEFGPVGGCKIEEKVWAGEAVLQHPVGTGGSLLWQPLAVGLA